MFVNVDLECGPPADRCRGLGDGVERVGAVIDPDVREFEEARSDARIAGAPDAGRWSARGPVMPPAQQPSPAPLTQAGPAKARPKRKRSIFRGLRRLWVPVVILAVVATGGFTVARLHGVFGSDKHVGYGDTRINDTKPFNPKHVTYEVFGAPGTVADISYFDGNGDPQRLIGAHLPWSFEYAITAATAVGNILAQGNTDSVGCRILVDGVVKSEKVVHETSAFTSCLLKAE